METKLSLGTVQFGQAYGVSNLKGQPSVREVRKILDYAAERGIKTLDTAPAYGNAESVLGQALSADHSFRFITKTPVLRELPANTAPASGILDTFELSLTRLNVNRVEGLIVHLAEDLLSPSGDQVWAALDHLKVSGRAAKIGTSCYTGEELSTIMERYPIDLVQIPLNIFDQRLIRDGTLTRLAERGVEVHARSAFLQGLALMDPGDLPPRFTRAEAPLRAFCAMAEKANLRPIELALRYVKSLPEIGQVVVGVNDTKELAEVIEAISGPIPGNIDPITLAIDDEAVLTPSMWPPDAQEKWNFDFSTENDDENL